MGLRLTIGHGDKVILSDGVVIDYINGSGRNGGEVTLNFEAPQEIKIHAIFKDSKKQFKNLKRND